MEFTKQNTKAQSNIAPKFLLRLCSTLFVSTIASGFFHVQLLYDNLIWHRIDILKNEFQQVGAKYHCFIIIIIIIIIIVIIIIYLSIYLFIYLFFFFLGGGGI